MESLAVARLRAPHSLDRRVQVLDLQRVESILDDHEAVPVEPFAQHAGST